MQNFTSFSEIFLIFIRWNRKWKKFPSHYIPCKIFRRVRIWTQNRGIKEGGAGKSKISVKSRIKLRDEDRYMRKSEKSMLFVGSKKTDFYIEGHTVKTNCIRFLILFYWRKKFCVHFEKYIFFCACFLIFSPFFPFDLFRRNLTLVLTKGRLSTAHLP